MSDATPASWRSIVSNSARVFAIAFVGTTIAFALWWRDTSGPEIVFIGSGNTLSVFVSDGPARMIIASGDDPIGYENAITSFQPLFARRVDLLLVAGDDQSLLVPHSASADPHVRVTLALAPLTSSSQSDALSRIRALHTPSRIRLGRNVTVTVETARQYGADPSESFPAWRATIERGESRVVVISDGAAAGLFPPSDSHAALAVVGKDPVIAWDLDPAVAFVASAQAINGPDMRAAFGQVRRPPAWGARISPGDALRIRFVDSGVEISSGLAQSLGEGGDDVYSTPRAALALPNSS